MLEIGVLLILVESCQHLGIICCFHLHIAWRWRHECAYGMPVKQVWEHMVSHHKEQNLICYGEYVRHLAPFKYLIQGLCIKVRKNRPKCVMRAATGDPFPCVNLANTPSESRSDIPWKVWNMVLEKDGQDQWGRSCEKWRSVTKNQGGEECPTNR